jgi:hypothetical protein
MKIKTRPDGADLLEGDELFQMNGWLAELRDDDRAEPQDEDRAASGDEDRAASRDDSFPWSPEDSHAGPREHSYPGPQEHSDARSLEDSHPGPQEHTYAKSRGGGYPRPQEHTYAKSREGGYPGPQEHGYAWVRDDARLEPPDDGRAIRLHDGQAKAPRHAYPRSETLAATPVTRPIARTRTTMRAVIGDRLRLPMMWCEMDSCICWYAHPAALGEADVRARAIDAGWRVDAVGLLVCPRCLQTASGFQSPHPVVLWDQEQAIAMSGPLADEPGADAADDAAWELSHDVQPPASSRQDEAVATSAWIAGMPASDVVRSASQETRHEIVRAPDDHQRESRLRPGRHRKRLVARLMLASQ